MNLALQQSYHLLSSVSLIHIGPLREILKYFRRAILRPQKLSLQVEAFIRTIELVPPLAYIHQQDTLISLLDSWVTKEVCMHVEASNKI